MGNIIKGENKILTPNNQFNRREVIIKGATSLVAMAGFGALGRAVFAANSVQTSPEVTEGPYWVDEKLNRSDIRTDPSGTVSGLQAGLPLFLSVTVSQLSGGVVTPVKNAVVDLWHCNALGIYSDISSERTSGQKWLRGYQITNMRGNTQFITVYPSWYSGRTIHIHARVRLFPNNDLTKTASHNFTTQFFFDDNISNHVVKNVSPYSTRPSRDTTNTNDMVFTGASFLSASDGVTSEAGDYLMLRLAEDGSHATGAFNMILDLTKT